MDRIDDHAPGGGNGSAMDIVIFAATATLVIVALILATS